jgi:type III pantothenate kinase
MILCVDIGNTDIAIGGYLNGELRFVTRVSTDQSRTSCEYEGSIRNLLSLQGVKEEDVTGAAISSVVPMLTSVMAGIIRDLYSVEAILVSAAINIGISIVCDDPSSVGADLICACVAAHKNHGSPSIIVDMGTATKMMLVNEQGVFAGVSIMPGVMMGMRALSSGTAQLPQFALDAPKRAIGTSTVECMKSGAVFGNAAMVDGMIDRFCEEYGEELPVYATGGYSGSIIPHCKRKITLDPNLVLDGLYIIYTLNK